MNTKAEFALPPGEVCRIIEACGKSGVRVLHYGALHLELGPAPEPQYPMVTLAVPDHVRQNAETLERDEDEIRAEQLALLAIEDPVEYERQLRDGELEDEPGESDIAE